MLVISIPFSDSYRLKEKKTCQDYTKAAPKTEKKRKAKRTKSTNQQTNKKLKSQNKQKNPTRKRGSLPQTRLRSEVSLVIRKEKEKRKKTQSRASFNPSERSWRIDSESAGSARFVSPDSYDSVVSPPCRAMSNPEAVLTRPLRTHLRGFQRIYRK